MRPKLDLKIGNSVMLASCVLAVVMTSLSSQALAYQEKAETAQVGSGLEKGPMQEISGTVNRILKLKFAVKDQKVEIDRESWGKKQNEAEMLKSLKAQLLERGMPKDRAEELAQRMLETQVRNAARSGPLNTLFSNLRTKAGMRSYSSSSSNNFVRLSAASADLNCSVGYSDSTLEMKVVESTGPSRSLDVVSNSGLRVLLTGDELVAILQQSKSGLMGVLIRGESVQSAKSSDYYTFCKEHPVLQAELAKLLRHAGVDLPLGINEPSVKKVALRMIGTMYSGEEGELAELLKSLDANEFETREKASKDLAAVYEQYEGAIQRQLAGADLSIEVRKRLEKVVGDNKSKRQADTRAQDCIEANKLLSSPQYLIGLLSVGNQKQTDVVVKHLEKLTGQKLGDDLRAWEAWSKQSAK